MSFLMLSPYTSYLAGNELIPRLTKNTASDSLKREIRNTSFQIIFLQEKVAFRLQLNLYNDHLWIPKFVTVGDRWSLYKGSSFI
jgi:hypothetical protein